MTPQQDPYYLAYVEATNELEVAKETIADLLEALKAILEYVEDAANKKSRFVVNWDAVNNDEGKRARAAIAKAE